MIQINNPSIQPSSISPSATQGILQNYNSDNDIKEQLCNNIIEMSTKEELSMYYHQTLCLLSKSTLLNSDKSIFII